MDRKKKKKKLIKTKIGIQAINISVWFHTRISEAHIQKRRWLWVHAMPRAQHPLYCRWCVVSVLLTHAVFLGLRYYLPCFYAIWSLILDVLNIIFSCKMKEMELISVIMLNNHTNTSRQNFITRNQANFNFKKKTEKIKHNSSDENICDMAPSQGNKIISLQ